MHASTEIEYRKMAARFYKDLNTINPSSIELKLAVFADKYSKSYWMKIRRAIVFDQKESGYSKPSKLISKIKYPVDAVHTPKTRRVRNISATDMSLFLRSESVPKHLKSALKIIQLTGCRPAELLKIQTLKNGKFVIEGVKKNKDMKRGADRTITIENNHQSEILSKSLKVLKRWSVGKKDTESALRQLMLSHSKRIFPRRIVRPSLYTVRHQFASNLKASSLSKKEISYLMGHQSSASIGIYGNRRAGKGKSAITRAANNEVAQQVVRDKSKPIPSPKPVKTNSISVSRHLKPSGYTR